ncbi:MAG: roadblock/LC7 domain-containing protein [Deltaproteobacteria bacterium]
MAFKEQLSEICSSVEGAVLASVMGFDGIAVETCEQSAPGMDIPTFLVELSNLVNQLRTAAVVLQSGAVEELVLSTEKLTVFSRPLTSDYFLLVALTPAGNWGKARYLMRIAAPTLRADL